MKSTLLIGAGILAGALLLSSCNDDLSTIGGSLVTSEVNITLDSLPTNIESRSIYYDAFDARTTTKLLGRINVPEYGSLSCSFVSQMLSAEKMNIPDSIPVENVDSMRFILSVARGNLTGDSLAPQQLRVYQLEKQLPSGITSSFDPEGYFSKKSLLGTKSYTLSNIAKGDSALKRDAYVRIPIHMPLSFAKDLFNKYRAKDPVLQWPSTFNQYFPGVYVEQNFGNGCIANITKAEVYTYWHYPVKVAKLQADSTYVYIDEIRRDSVCLLASQPEVVSSNIISYEVSQSLKDLAESGKSILTTPGGYLVEMSFPAQHLLDLYHSGKGAMSVVSSLKFEIPATTIKNDYGLTVAPWVLMVKRNEMESFFAENKVPDGLNSFYAKYDADSGSYKFNGMRAYFLDLLSQEKKGEAIDEEDTEFVIVPVNITTETVEGYNSSATYVTRCAPYMLKPTLTQLFTERCIVSFTYSSQQID